VGSPLAEAAAELQARHIPDWDKPAAQHRDNPAADRDWDRRAANIVVQPPAVSRPPRPRWQLLRRRGGAGWQLQVGRTSLEFPLAWLVGPWRVGGRVRCIASRPDVPRTTRYLRLWSRGLLLALLRSIARHRHYLFMKWYRMQGHCQVKQPQQEIASIEDRMPLRMSSLGTTLLSAKNVNLTKPNDALLALVDGKWVVLRSPSR
jgi:hypothetical protein